jgi:tetratricopeptide (TPR) repeat protein
VKKICKYILSFIVCFCSLCSSAQEDKLDSLLLALKNIQTDTSKLHLLYLISNECDEEDILKYATPAVALAEAMMKTSKDLSTETKKSILKYKAGCLSNIGFAFQSKSEYLNAIDYYTKSLKIFEEINDKIEIAITYNNIAVSWQSQGDINKALGYYEKGLKIQESINDKAGIATTLGNLGVIYHDQGNTPKALECYFKGLKIEEELGAKSGMAISLNCIGGIYNDLGDIEKAIFYFSKSIKIHEETGNKEGLAQSLGNIGAIYKDQDDIIKALEFFNKSLKINEEIGRKEGISTCYNNIGACYSVKGDYTRALEYYEKSLTIEEKIGNKIDISRSLSNIGNIYEKLGDYSKSLDIYQRGIILKKELGDKKGITQSYSNISSIYFKLSIATNKKTINSSDKKLKLYTASAYADSALKIAKEIGFPVSIIRAERMLSKIDSAKGNFIGAYEHYKQYIIFRDSINNETTRKASVKNQLKYEYEKKEAVIKEQHEKERLVAKEKDRFQQIVILSVIIGLLFVVVFALFVFRSLKVTKQQKHIIEEKQKEILDSIRYAKRIQTSLLPTEKYITKHLFQSQNK